MRSNTVTATPPSASRSAAISPAGPAPTIVAWLVSGSEVLDGARMIERVETVVLGAGVVGLAVRQEFCAHGLPIRNVCQRVAAGGPAMAA